MGGMTIGIVDAEADNAAYTLVEHNLQDQFLCQLRFKD